MLITPLVLPHEAVLGQGGHSFEAGISYRIMESKGRRSVGLPLAKVQGGRKGGTGSGGEKSALNGPFIAD